MILGRKFDCFHSSPESVKAQLVFAPKTFEALNILCSHTISGLELGNDASGDALVAVLQSDWLIIVFLWPIWDSMLYNIWSL